jgi:hypothetical protein
MTRTVRCCFDGCRATSEHPLTDGWTNIVDWGHGIADGFYCRAHADALNQVCMRGGFEDPENDLKGDATKPTLGV